MKKKKQTGFLYSHPHLEFYCTFIGTPKSGHSLIGSLLDAHPNMIIAHELHVLKCLALGFSGDSIFSLILKNSDYYAQRGRNWSGYSYGVANQWNGKYKGLRVIGDKKGGGTAAILFHNPRLLDDLLNVITLRHKFIHVVRNPFDCVTTLSAAIKENLVTTIDHYSKMSEAISLLKNRVPAADFLEIQHERFIVDPQKQLHRLCRFLGQSTPCGYLDDCAAIVNSVAHKSRFTVSWRPQEVKMLERIIKAHPFLEGYAFDPR